MVEIGSGIAKEAQAWVVCLVENFVKLEVDYFFLKLHCFELYKFNACFEVRRVTLITACCLMMKSIPMNKSFIPFRRLSTARRRKLLVLQQQ